MPCKLFGIEAKPRCVLLDYIGDALIGQPLAYAAVPVDTAKYCARLNAGDGDPLFERGYVRDAELFKDHAGAGLL